MANDVGSSATASSSLTVEYIRPRVLTGMFALAAAYFVAAKLGLSLAVSAEQVSVVWPPTGIALAAVVIFGYRVWPGIWIGAFAANVTASEPIATACGIAIGNTLEAIIGAWLLQRCVAFEKSLERLKDVLGLIVLAACISTVVSATIGVTSLCLGGVHPWSQFLSLWSMWWLGDAMGNLVVAPIILTATSPRASWSLPRTVEASALALGLTAVGLVLNGWTPAETVHHSLAYTIFPFVIWAALRFGQSGTTMVTGVVSVFTIWGAIRGVGPFGWGPVEERLVSLQAFLGIVAMTGLLLAAVLAERRRDEQRRSVLHAVAQILAESATLSDATPQIIERICEGFAWQVGAIWQVDRDRKNLSCAGVWRIGSANFPSFEAITRQRTFEKGLGLPGRVWASGEPAWIPDVVRDSNFPRAYIANREGLHGAFGFPIRLGADVYGVIEFFSSEIRQPDEDLLQTMGTIGIQIGQFIERRHRDEEVRRSEARKSAILESALDAIITIDHQGVIVEFNPAAEKMFGWRRNEAIGKLLVDLIIPPSLKEKHRQGMMRYLATGDGPILDKRLELQALRSDGAEFPIELAVTPIHFSGPPMFTGYIRDITDRKRLEHDLRGQAAQLLAVDRRKNEFLATLAHELRNPLAPLRNGLEIWRLGRHDTEAIASVRDMMERQLAQMVRLVDDLLDLSRISRGLIELRRERAELAKIVQQAVETSRPLIEQAGHHFSLHMPQSPVYVDADVTRMAQVFTNILNNAAKYTPRGGQICLSVKRRDDQVVVSIKDNGIGIPAELLPNVFDMFTQVNQNLDRSSSGLGIGLSIVKRLVVMHGGSVEGQSDGQGKGSEFTVRLPVALTVVQPESEDKEPARVVSGRRVLVVDDNRDAASSLAVMLKLMGNDAKTANDGLEALQVAAAYRPDLILLDIGMPKLNGYEAARKIREQPWGKQVLLVAITGWGQDDVRQKAEDAGFDEHIVKPIEPAALQKLLVSSSAATG